jgi:hypothetical protein
MQWSERSWWAGSKGSTVEVKAGIAEFLNWSPTDFIGLLIRHALLCRKRSVFVIHPLRTAQMLYFFHK